MLEVARQLAPEVQWRQGRRQVATLPGPILRCCGLMFFSDRREALRQALRVLTPGERLTFAVWDSLDNIPVYAAEGALLERLAGRQPTPCVCPSCSETAWNS